VAPIVGALIAGFSFRFLLDRTASDSYLEPLELSGESKPKK